MGEAGGWTRWEAGTRAGRRSKGKGRARIRVRQGDGASDLGWASRLDAEGADRRKTGMTITSLSGVVAMNVRCVGEGVGGMDVDDERIARHG